MAILFTIITISIAMILTGLLTHYKYTLHYKIPAHE